MVLGKGSKKGRTLQRHSHPNKSMIALPLSRFLQLCVMFIVLFIYFFFGVSEVWNAKHSFVGSIVGTIFNTQTTLCFL